MGDLPSSAQASRGCVLSWLHGRMDTKALTLPSHSHCAPLALGPHLTMSGPPRVIVQFIHTAPWEGQEDGQGNKKI